MENHNMVTKLQSIASRKCAPSMALSLQIWHYHWQIMLKKKMKKMHDKNDMGDDDNDNNNHLCLNLS